MDTLVRKFVELVLVSLKLSDEVHEVLGFLESIKIFSINNIAELIFNLNNEFNDVQAVETVILEG